MVHTHHLNPDDVACPACDLMVHIGQLRDGDTAVCPRCGHFITRFRSDAYNRVLAFAFGGLILLLLANSYDFLSFAAGGAESQITLRETPGALWANGMPLVAVLVGAFIIGIPAIILMVLVALCVPLHSGYNRPWLPTLAKAVIHLQHWAMAEVFIIGVIVSLVKLSSMATVVVGVSFWAYAGFTVCFLLAVSNLDRYQTWERIEQVSAV
ncbi:MAG: paraquat-inducible protein A [Halioglobus sp.]